MYWRAAIVSMFLIGAGTAPAAHAVEITTYGTGLKACDAYLDARERDDPDQIAFIDWLSGYLSGVNATSKHRNNLLGLSDVQGAMNWLDDYCRARPSVHFAQAVGMLLMVKTSSIGAHSVEVTSYGSGFKSCAEYLEARERQYMDGVAFMDRAAFIDWLSGYLSGVNAMSLSTTNVLGHTELPEAVQWLNGYCSAHATAPFTVAIEALMGATRHGH
jgi:predicted MarR family transcription regulator